MLIIESDNVRKESVDTENYQTPQLYSIQVAQQEDEIKWLNSKKSNFFKNLKNDKNENKKIGKINLKRKRTKSQNITKGDNIENSSSSDLSIFLKEERRIQQEILNKNALKIEELEGILVENQSETVGIQEPVETSVKLNLLNIINNDRIENQILAETSLHDEDIASEENCNAKHCKRINIQGTTLSTTQGVESVDNYHKINNGNNFIVKEDTNEKYFRTPKGQTASHNYLKSRCEIIKRRANLRFSKASSIDNIHSGAQVAPLNILSQKSNERGKIKNEYWFQKLKKSKGPKYIEISIIGNNSEVLKSS